MITYFQSDAVARNRGNRGSTLASSAGSTKPPPWLATTTTGPSRGNRSRPVTSTLRNHPNAAMSAIHPSRRSNSCRIAASCQTRGLGCRAWGRGRHVCGPRAVWRDRRRSRRPGPSARSASPPTRRPTSTSAGSPPTTPGRRTSWSRGSSCSARARCCSPRNSRIDSAVSSGPGRARPCMGISGLAVMAAGALRRDRMSNFPLPGEALVRQSWRNDGHDIASVDLARERRRRHAGPRPPVPERTRAGGDGRSPPWRRPSRAAG